MKRALIDNWALFLGMLGLMVANGLLVTLLSIRGAELGFSSLTISIMQACYPLGALIGTITVPLLIEKVGHIRVFSALASMVSVAAIVHILTFDPYSWSAMRFMAGICFPGLYVVTESWLNAKSENRIRAQVLSVYFIIQTIGPALGTALVAVPDPSGNLLFGLTSVLMSVAVVPLLLSGNRAPDYSAPDRMTVRRLYTVSPMAVLGIILMSAAVASWFIALPLYALYQGFSAAAASGALVAAMIAGGLVQYPIGWISDNTDRRYVVIGLCVVATCAAVWMAVDTAPARTVWGFAIIGGATLPIYSILAAHANDHLTPGQVVPASGTMAFLQQFGQVFGMLLGPNLIAFGGGRGLQGMVIVVSLAVIFIAVARRVRSEAPAETGEVVHFGAMGLGQAGVLQAETVAAEAEAEAASEAGAAGRNRQE
ncbi:MFS transporter [Roseovarius nubinhibens]|uniref:Transporter, Major facilitator superfamily protein (MFS) n=4 Tax=Roseovarius nubinhibens TaxID=314263 RepID=A3SLS8_ROSNI|nr:MFS transporter [Roseovarius nubinhibens]EAP78309.1 Transporter, Major facilitator superfamily protein (MFS) [Roseovarius nubinhibens ISM]